MMTIVRFGFLAVVIGGLCSAHVQAQTTRSSFTNNTSNAIPAVGPAATYPSTISVSGVTGVVYHMTVTVRMTHSFPADVQVVLRSPDGPDVLLFTLIGANEPWSQRSIVLDDCAPLGLRPGTVSAGRYRPGVALFGQTMPDSGPVPSYGTLSDLNWESPNGSWSLYVADMAEPDAGVIDSWSLTFFTQPLASAPVTNTSGVNPISCSKPDFDGDGRADIGIYRPETGQWFVQNSGSSGTFFSSSWGAPASSGADDVAVPEDYDGDGITDLAVYRRSTGDWWVRHATGVITNTSFGAPSGTGAGDIPVPADYDGDGKADRAVYRATQGTWWVLSSAKGTATPTLWGNPPSGDYPAQ